MPQHRRSKVCVGLQARHPKLGQRVRELPCRLHAVGAAGDNLCDHGIVVCPHLLSSLDAGVDADVAAKAEPRPPGGDLPPRERPRCWEKVPGRVLRVQPRLDGMALGPEILLRERQTLPRGHAELQLHKVEPGDRLCDGVLDLQAGVHLHEEVLAGGGVHDELDGAGIDISDGAGGRYGGGADPPAELLGQPGRRRLLEHLLVAPLDAAVALKQVHRVAVAVGEDLDFDMAGGHDEALQQHPVVPKCRGRLALGGSERLLEFPGGARELHALPASAHHGLHKQREPDARGLRSEP
mmetsp:Transcript_20450/g.48691  ORF Transcript_20450/g.48691 Transcript_20450/m.48691 type:complete len:295 (+) Transcript_20450:1044-1928(+)